METSRINGTGASEQVTPTGKGHKFSSASTISRVQDTEQPGKKEKIKPDNILIHYGEGFRKATSDRSDELNTIKGTLIENRDKKQKLDHEREELKTGIFQLHAVKKILNDQLDKINTELEKLRLKQNENENENSKNLTSANKTIEDFSKALCADAKKIVSEGLDTQVSRQHKKLIENNSTISTLFRGSYYDITAQKNTKALCKIELKEQPAANEFVRKEVQSSWPYDVNGNTRPNTPSNASDQPESHPTSSNS
jgi:hypothetical protein